jgi:hypothetical protein
MSLAIKEHQTLSWRHFGCITPKIFDNIKKDFPTASEVEGFEGKHNNEFDSKST